MNAFNIVVDFCDLGRWELSSFQENENRTFLSVDKYFRVQAALVNLGNAHRLNCQAVDHHCGMAGLKLFAWPEGDFNSTIHLAKIFLKERDIETRGGGEEEDENESLEQGAK